MLPLSIQVIVCLLLSRACVVKSDKYASNQSPNVIDAPHVAEHFPPLDGINLLSPVFTNPGDVPETFAKGNSGPTSQKTLG